jgi:hypothetical protein
MLNKVQSQAGMPADSLIDKIGAAARSKVPPLAAPQLGSCASSGRARRLWAAQRSQGRGRSTGRPAAAPTAPAAPGARAIPTSKAADFTAVEHAGRSFRERAGSVGVNGEPSTTSTPNPKPGPEPGP